MTFHERYQYNPKTDLIGKGGFARVYKATDVLLGRVVALKFFVNQVDEKHTLIQEISRAIQLEHPNLCRYYDAALIENTNVHGETEKIEVGVMEYLDGGDLRKFVKQHPEYLHKLLADVLDGLAFLHKKNIIHRDLKAQNILIKLTEDGPVAKITDFGISKSMDGSTSSSMAVGTIEYMAPEQFNPNKYGINGKISTNVDLWSFGIMVHELLTDEPLFGLRNGDTTAEQIMSAILSTEVPQDIENLPEPYKTAVKKCLIKDAKERAQKASEVQEALAGKVANQTPGSSDTVVLTKKAIPADATMVYAKQQPAAQKETIYVKGGPVAENKKRKKWLVPAVIAGILVIAAAWWFIGSAGHKKLYPYMDAATNKWGFADDKGKLIIPAIYDYADSFYNGIAVINSNKKFGYIDSTGTVIVQPKYVIADPFFQKEMATVSNAGWVHGAIDRTGKEVIPEKYIDIMVIDGIRMLVDTTYTLIVVNGRGQEITRGQRWAINYVDGKIIKQVQAGVDTTSAAGVDLSGVCVYDTSGNIVEECGKYSQYLPPLDGKGGLIMATKVSDDRRHENMGYLDNAGNIVVPFNLDRSSLAFMEGFAPVREYKPDDLQNSTGKVGVINSQGKMVVPFKYDYVDYNGFQEGMLAVANGNKMGFIDTAGNEAVPLQFDNEIMPDRVYNTLPPDNPYFYPYFSNGLAAVAQNNKMGYVDKTGHVVIPCQFQYEKSFSSGGVAVVFKDDKWWLIDKKGNQVTTGTYTNLYYTDGYYLASLNNKWGLLDNSGKQLLPCEYDNIRTTRNGLFTVIQNGSAYTVNASNTKITDAINTPFGQDSSAAPAKVLQKWRILSN